MLIKKKSADQKYSPQKDYSDPKGRTPYKMNEHNITLSISHWHIENILE
jgi:hypothetical protein